MPKDSYGRKVPRGSHDAVPKGPSRSKQRSQSKSASKTTKQNRKNGFKW